MTVGNSPAADDMIYFGIFRKASDTTNDTFADDADLIGVSIQYREHLTVEAAW